MPENNQFIIPVKSGTQVSKDWIPAGVHISEGADLNDNKILYDAWNRLMYRSGPIFSIIISILVSAFFTLIPVCAAEDAIKNVLPSSGFSDEWTMEDKVTFYTTDTLFDHINGEAELYFPYGFDTLASATYINKANPQLAVVADVYRMGSLIDAFGIYSNYRKTDAAFVAIGAEGFISSSQLMYYQDRYFVRLQASGTTSIGQEIFFAFGRAVSRNLPPVMGFPRELEVLRIQGVVPKSERYIAKSLLGYAFFRRGVIADAILEGERVQVFMVPEDSQDTARKSFDQYGFYLKAEGRDVRLTETPDRISVSAVDPLYGGVLVQQSGRYIIGAVRMKKTSHSSKLIEHIQKKLSGG